MKNIDVLIIGAGAAGLMCAIEAGRRNRSVLVLDHANKAGKKILMSGGGRCNFTNLQVTPENFISNNPHFCRSALSRYTPADFIEMVDKYKIEYHEKTLGQLFCNNKSKDILNMLLREASDANVEIHLETKVDSIKQQENKSFIVKTAGEVINCESLVVASGGLSIPTMGASPLGYKIAEQFGLRVWPTRAGLVPFTAHVEVKNKLEKLSGISFKGAASCAGKQFTEGVLFTHRGLSGPAILQISSYWNPGDSVKIDCLPGVDLAAELQSIYAYGRKNNQAHSKNKSNKNNLQQTLRQYMTKYFSKRHLDVWLPGDIADMPISSLSKAQLDAVVSSFKSWMFLPNATEGYRTAEVTLGGVDCNAISSKTMQCNSVPGLFFIGEVLDVTGWLGGYNFQWAWASGFAAGAVV